MEPISRRRALQLGGLGLAGTVGGGAGVAYAATGGFTPVTGAALTSPPCCAAATACSTYGWRPLKHAYAWAGARPPR